MEFAELKELMVLFNESSIREFDIQKDGSSLYLSKNEQNRQLQPPLGPVIQEPLAPIASPTIVSTPSNEEQPVVEAAKAGSTIDSPIVGVVYLSSGPGEAAFKQVGDHVAVGDTLCIIEAMKIMNDITSDVAGTLTEILIENEDVVEYGQPLFRIL